MLFKTLLCKFSQRNLLFHFCSRNSCRLSSSKINPCVTLKCMFLYAGKHLMLGVTHGVLSIGRILSFVFITIALNSMVRVFQRVYNFAPAALTKSLIKTAHKPLCFKGHLNQTPSTPISLATCCLRHGVMLPLEAFEMRKHILTLSRTKPRCNAEEILET